MKRFRYILDVGVTAVVLLSASLVLLFGIGLFVTGIDVECNFWVSASFVVTAIAALDPIVKAERVLKVLLILAMLAAMGYLYLDYILDDLFQPTTELPLQEDTVMPHREFIITTDPHHYDE